MSRELRPGGAREASLRRSLGWLGEPRVSFVDNNNKKMLPNKEPRVKIILYLENTVSA